MPVFWGIKETTFAPYSAIRPFMPTCCTGYCLLTQKWAPCGAVITLRGVTGNSAVSSQHRSVHRAPQHLTPWCYPSTSVFTVRRHFTTATPFRVHAMWIYSADRTCCCQSPFPSLQLLAALTASLVSYGVVTLRISHNGFHCRTRFSHPFCLELLFVAPIIL